MMDALKSAFIWITTAILILIWLPLLAVARLFDRDPVCYRTGRLFRKLGKSISRINPNWKITISGNITLDDRSPYIIVCNHLSQADIPLISNLPWEMKWVAKKELFDLPVIGWMMKMAGDISVDRRAENRKEFTFEQCHYYLSRNCSVMFFPEGTRSRNGRLNAFTKGAFDLAIREQLPVLPLVIDGTQNTLPKRSWRFGYAPNIRLKVLDPISSKDLGRNDISRLTSEVRNKILQQLTEWRNEPIDKVDNLTRY